MLETSKFYREVRRFALTEPVYSTARQTVRTLPSERYHLAMVALRVYGDATETLTIMAAAGLPTVDSELKEQDLVLPTTEQLLYIKQLCGITVVLASVR